MSVSPQSPTGLAATPVSAAQVNLSWTPPSGVVSGYNVYRGTTSGGENYSTPLNGGTLLTGTTYSDTTAGAGTTYYYTVEAVNAVASSGASTEASASTPPGLVAWSGGGSTTAWSNPANWGGVTLVANDVLSFSGGSGLNNSNNLAAGTPFNGMIFNPGAGQFILNGNAVDLDGGVVNNSASTQTINLGLSLVGGTGTVDTAAGNVTIVGNIGGNYGLDKTGPGTLTLTGSNSYTGPTVVSQGTLLVRNGSALLAGSSLTVGNNASVFGDVFPNLVPITKPSQPLPVPTSPFAPRKLRSFAERKATVLRAAACDAVLATTEWKRLSADLAWLS